MSIEFKADGDFASVIDGHELVTLRRNGGWSELVLPAALRSFGTEREAEPSEGDMVAGDLVWEFELPAAEAPPAIGEEIFDSEQRCWRILRVEPLRLGTRYRLQTRCLEIAYRLSHLVEVQESVVEDLGSGPEVTGWQTIRPAVRARIQPEETEIDQSVSPATSQERFRIFLGDSIPLNHTHRLVDRHGNAFQIDRYLSAERIDALPVAEVTMVDT